MALVTNGGIALTSTVFWLGAITGPLLAGALLPVLGLSTPYLIDALGLCLAVWAVWRLPPLPPRDGAARRAGARQVLEGFGYLAGRRILLIALLADFIAMLFGMPRALFPQVARETFRGPPGAGSRSRRCTPRCRRERSWPGCAPAPGPPPRVPASPPTVLRRPVSGRAVVVGTAAVEEPPAGRAAWRPGGQGRGGMSLSEREREFLERHHSAAMVTLRADGSPHVVRVGVAMVDGRIWSSGTRARVRTGNLRRDPRATLFVFDERWRSLSLDSTVTILEGPDAPELSLRLFRTMQQGLDPAPSPGTILWEGTERDPEEFLRIMDEEQRLIYQFEVVRSYGLI
jgi:PPOX class probable F420-dependent enzyme